jgi:putative endonuclease
MSDTPMPDAPMPDTRAPDAPAAWSVYLIECRDGSLYTGVALDVPRRFREHVAGKGARYTRSHPPRRLVAVIAAADRSDALRAEARIKRLRTADKRLLCGLHPPPDQLEA